MKRGGPTKLGIGIVVVIVALLLVGGLIWIGRSFFGGSSAKTDSDALSAGQKLLNKPTADTAVRLSVRGPITAQETHYSIAETISATSRNLTIWRAYDGTVMTNENLSNSAGAFSDLLAALNRAGFMKQNGNTDVNQGICAIGQLIQFEILQYPKNDKGEITEKSVGKLWTTSCAGLGGNFDGLAANVIDLFLNQIPDARNRIAAAKNDLDSENRAAIGNPWEGLNAFKNN